MDAEHKRRIRPLLFRLWYLCIGLGFLALAARAWLEGDQLWRVAARIAIAGGFLLLAKWAPRPR